MVAPDAIYYFCCHFSAVLFTSLSLALFPKYFVITIVSISMTRFSMTESHEPHGPSSSGLRRVSEGAKRFSQSFIGLISKAYNTKSPEPDQNVVDFFSNPLKNHITECITTLRKSDLLSERIDAVRSLGHISVTGGNETSGFIGKFVIPDLAVLLREKSEPFEVKLAAIEAISEMCAFCMKENQNLCKKYGILLFLIEGLKAHSSKKELLMRQWCAHSLFYCLADHVENKRYVLNYNVWTNLQGLTLHMHPDETFWEFNDAEMLLEMLRR